jgi:hypothetical protein
MAKKKQLHTVEVSRKRWLRGKTKGVLRNQRGLQCCLGFVCRAAGWKARDLVDQGMPHSLYNRETKETVPDMLKGLIVTDWWYPAASDLADMLAEMNDDKDITDAQREARIIKHGKKAGINFVFVE